MATILAESEGIIPTKNRLVLRLHGLRIVETDCSGNGSYGYDYCLTVRPPRRYYHLDDSTFLRLHKLPRVEFGRTVRISLPDERNKAGGIGAFAVRWAPETFSAAVADAVAWIESHPEFHC